MRGKKIAALQGWMRRLSRLEWAAVLVLLGYGLIAFVTQVGATVAGQGLDPVWAGVQQRGVLRVAVDFGYAPFSAWHDGVESGYDIDLARAVASKLGVRVEFVGSSLDSIYDDLTAGKADLAASALPYAPEQGWRVIFSEFYFNAGQVLVVPVGSPISSERDLSGRIVGAALGSDGDSYARRLAAADTTIQLHSEFDTAAEVLTALRDGLLDAAIVDNATALTAITREPGLRLVTALTLEPYALAMPNRTFQLHARVNTALDELRREGFFEELGATWFR